jgi:hypothetical protein
MSFSDYQTALFMLGCIARLTLAAIFAGAAVHSVRDWPGYTAIVTEYRVAPRGMGILASWVLPPLQGVAAVALLAWPGPGALLGLALLALFTGALAVNLRRGRLDIDCGCGGADGQQISAGLVLRNLLLMAFLAGAMGAPLSGETDIAAYIGVAGGAAFCIATYFAANQLLANQQRLSAGARSAA